jgi:hypothetical protein
MSLVIDQAFASISNLKLWFKVQSGDPLKLSDIPDLIPLRWDYFKENWEFIKPDLIKKIENYAYPSQLESHIEGLSKFIENQRNSTKKDTNPFSDSSIINRFYAVFDNMVINAIPTTRVEDEIIEDRSGAVRRYIKTDFLGIRSDLVAGRLLISDTVGGSDDDYNAVYSRSSPTALRDIKIADVQNMKVLMDGVKSCDFIIANSTLLDTVQLDPFALATQNANNPDIQIPTSKSGFLVKMFYGDTLQDLAVRHLGDPDRWIEIAIANGLKAPYIDEVGEAIPLLSNASGTQINLSGTADDGSANIDKFSVGQAIFLKSDVVINTEQRSIISIKKVPVSGEIILELDGDPDLDRFKISENAYVRVYLPNTTNSQFFISIPTPQPPDAEVPGTVPFFLKTKAEDERKAGVDLLLNNDNDLQLTAAGDLDISFGIQNAVQAIKLKLEVERGSLERHSNFGLPAVQGRKNSGVTDIQNEITLAIRQAVEVDPRFDRVENIDVQYTDDEGPVALRFRVEVRMAGSGSLIPLSFTVNTN